ncbi:hypothetical protein DPMN_037654 [Dreissena polymorpha]|uniref:Uncharacterized protein n=1 Tax=Dreissena polymorpha TaxID=45954 RepID=A0A9D4RMI4_DREPO|nr:hypothetical protein DPMN_037654 [Dreissena polymorpha]
MQLFGTVESSEQTFTVASKLEENITRNCDITAVCELPNGTIVLADAANKSLKLLNESFQLLSQCYLQRPPLDISVVGN